MFDGMTNAPKKINMLTKKKQKKKGMESPPRWVWGVSYTGKPKIIGIYIGERGTGKKTVLEKKTSEKK